MLFEEITVIIPTAARKNRKLKLLKAIDSVLSQRGVRAIPFVLVNGDTFDNELNEALKRRSDIRYIYLAEPSQVKAVAFGVNNVTTKYFSFLDDDDEYLEDALITRLMPMLQDEHIGLSVTNGYKHGVGDEYLFPFDEKEFSLKPLESLLISPWLTSCSGLFKTSLIDPKIFHHSYSYLEWTYLASVLSHNTKIHFDKTPTFLINLSENSLSSSPLMEVTRARLMHEISKKPIPDNLVSKFVSKKFAALHMASESYLRNNEIIKAWRYHVMCIFSINGFKYITYTYKLVLTSLVLILDPLQWF